MSESAASWKWSELALELVLQTALIAGLSALSFWLWPARMFDPATTIKPGDWFLAALSLWVGLLALITFYFLVVQPLMALMKDEDAPFNAAEDLHSDQAKNP